MPEEPYSSNSPTGVQDRLPDSARDAREKVKDVASQAKQKASELADKASQYGRTALEKVDEKRTDAASALESTASGIRSSGERVTQWGEAAAEKLQGTAQYLRDHDTRRMAGDLEAVVRRNPGPSMLIAAAFGFFLGAALRRD